MDKSGSYRAWPMMRIGHGRAALRLIEDEPMGGYGDRVGGVRGRLDDLEIQVVIFAAAEGRFALVVCDLVCVNVDLVSAVRDLLTRQFSIDRVWVSATHTHAGPESGCVPGGTITRPSLQERVVAACEVAAAAARRGEQPGAVTAARAEVADLAGRRSSPHRAAQQIQIPVDSLVVHHRGRIRGVVSVVPVHATVLPAENRAASADLPGAIRSALVTSFAGRGSDAWAVVAAGAAGDISTRHTRRGRDVGELHRIGGHVAATVLPGIDAPPTEDGGDGLRFAAPLRLAMAPKSSADHGRLRDGAEHVSGNIAGPGADHDDGSARTGWTTAQGMDIARRLALENRSRPYAVEVDAVRIGSVTLVAIAGEPFLTLGEQIREATRSATGEHDRPRLHERLRRLHPHPRRVRAPGLRGAREPARCRRRRAGRRRGGRARAFRQSGPVSRSSTAVHGIVCTNLLV